MSRIYARDIITLVKQKLTSDFQTMLDAIDTARGETTPDVLSITDLWSKSQYPEIYISVTDSSFLYGEQLDQTVEQLGEIFTLEIIATIRSGEPMLPNYLENYLEAIYRVLHNCTLAGITWVLAKESMRDDIQQVENVTQKKGGIRFEVRVL